MTYDTPNDNMQRKNDGQFTTKMSRIVFRKRTFIKIM